MRPERIRDFVRDYDGWLYAVAAYDNEDKVGCILRYIPDPQGDREDASGRVYRKVGFEEGYSLIHEKKPEYDGLIPRIPHDDIEEVLKPDERVHTLITQDDRVRRLNTLFGLSPGSFGVTGSLLCGLDKNGSDIDSVVYGSAFYSAQQSLQRGIKEGIVDDLDDDLWHAVYLKRNPDLSYDEFLLHEQRKWNRGQIQGTYFDILYSRGYEDLPVTVGKGEVLGKERITATVTGDTYAFDSPAVYEIDHPAIAKVLSFTHTYTGQAFTGEHIEAQGFVEQHGDECWLIVGTSREAKGEYIRSLTLLEGKI